MQQPCSAYSLTPKEVAWALGVSESSVKRWVDRGTLAAITTAGGHRKLAVADVVHYARESGIELARPEILGVVTRPNRKPLGLVVNSLVESLCEGNATATREILLAAYQLSHSCAAIGDELLCPAMRELGTRWEKGKLSVHEERRACEMTASALHEIRAMMPTPAPNAPLAMVTTAAGDHAELPIRVAELVLRENGWNVTLLGVALPLCEIAFAVKKHKPKLSLLSATHLDDPTQFVVEFREIVYEPTKQATTWLLGGGALPAELSDDLPCDHSGRSMSELAGIVRAIANQPVDSKCSET